MTDAKSKEIRERRVDNMCKVGGKKRGRSVSNKEQDLACDSLRSSNPLGSNLCFTARV